MAPSTSNYLQHDFVGAWLRRLALAVSVVLLVLCCWFVWRLSMVVYQMEDAIVSISADVKQMSSTGAQISEHLQKLDDRLRSIEEKTAEAVNLDEVEHVFDELAEIRHRDTTPESGISPKTEREIRHLLSQIRRSDYRFTYSVFGSDKSKSGTQFYIQLYAKYKTYEDALSSAEDFIDKVATTTIGGNPYHVFIDANKTVALKDWLSDELATYRASAVATPDGD